MARSHIITVPETFQAGRTGYIKKKRKKGYDVYCTFSDIRKKPGLLYKVRYKKNPVKLDDAAERRIVKILNRIYSYYGDLPENDYLAVLDYALGFTHVPSKHGPIEEGDLAYLDLLNSLSTKKQRQLAKMAV